ncbi:MAG: DUF126 domain-containing protein [Candidatus Thermoplasmatota archaeon]|jgi:predicted aconitase with swiveling domain|nr:DUF126 domain-containing protein [Candidatus Thermoplasmatota archaeon]
MGDSLIKGRGMAPGKTTSTAMVCNQYISPLGEMSKSGVISSGLCEGRSFSDKILIFKGGRGSTVGSYVILELKNKNLAPSGIINETAEQVVLTGAIISEIPMIDQIPIDIFVDGDTIEMDGKKGTVEIKNAVLKDIATVFLIFKGKLLVLKRSSKVSSYPDMYGGVSGYVEEGERPEETGARELREECDVSDARLLRKGELVYVRHENTLFRITPLLMEPKDDSIKLNWENSQYFWVSFDELSRFETVPKFKEAFKELTRP